MAFKDERRLLGEHLTSTEIFEELIFPEIKNDLYNFLWIDLYAGEGNLIFPILNHLRKEERIDFFKDHIFLSDIQEKMVHKCIETAKNYGIEENIAQQNIKLHDNLKNIPVFLKKNKYPVYHITNPPYLYIGYIRKHKETQKYVSYFDNKNKGYQDLYQIAMVNDLRNRLANLIYIIPSNFLFGASVSNKIREDFLKNYYIKRVIIFEKQIFEFTGTNICLCFFRRKQIPSIEIQEFNGIKVKKENQILEKIYTLKPKFKYRAGSEFEEFLKNHRANNPPHIKYYLLMDEVSKNNGINKIDVIDANNYQNNEYKKLTLEVNEGLENRIKSNILFVRTVDTGSDEGRVGINIIKNEFNVDGILVSGNTYRTHPIQIFFVSQISVENQKLLKNYFNLLLEHFREKLDSEFLTTYKYSNAKYTRKYLGLTYVKRLIETYPYLDFNKEQNETLKNLILNNDVGGILNLLENHKKHYLTK